MNDVNRRMQFPPMRVALAAVAGGATGALANIGLFLLLRAQGVDFRIQPSPAAPVAPITVSNIAVASFVPALLAGGLLMLLGRFTTRARTVFVIVACAFAILSFAGPGTIGGASAATRVALIFMHLIAAVVIVGALMSSAVTAEPRGVASPTIERA